MNTCSTCACDRVCDHDKYGFENCDNYIPTGFAEVKHGKWDTSGRYEFADGSLAIRCSECGCSLHSEEYEKYHWNYCPFCGAKMDGVKGRMTCKDDCLYYKVCSDFRGNICETDLNRFMEYRGSPDGLCEHFKNKADFVEVQHGDCVIDRVEHIVPVGRKNSTKRISYKCSECGRKFGNNKYLNYCPHCGAKMDGRNGA